MSPQHEEYKFRTHAASSFAKESPPKYSHCTVIITAGVVLCYLLPFTAIVLLLQQMTASLRLGPICSYIRVQVMLVSFLFFFLSHNHSTNEVLCSNEPRCITIKTVRFCMLLLLFSSLCPTVKSAVGPEANADQP